MKRIDARHFLLDLKLFGRTKAQLLEILCNWQNLPTGAITVFTPNPEQLMLAKERRSFAKTLRLADVCLPDGVGLVWASRLLAWRGVVTTGNEGAEAVQRIEPVMQRIAGVEVVEALLDWASKEQKRVLIVGGRDYHELEELVSGTAALGRVVWTPGYVDKAAQTAAERAVVAGLIESYKPEIVFVALGAPWQEEWAIEHRSLLEKHGARIVMVVGGSFDMLLGKVPRAPHLIQIIGLEWLYRLVQEPWRWRRQLQLVKFISWIAVAVMRGRA